MAKYTDQLNSILKYLHDSYNGFNEAHEKIENLPLKAFFQELANQRQAMIADLQTDVTLSGETPEESGSISGAAHRLYLDLKSLLTGGDVDAVVNEVKRGESHLLKQYDEVLPDAELPANIRAKLVHQRDIIANYLQRIETLAASAKRTESSDNIL